MPTTLTLTPTQNALLDEASPTVNLDDTTGMDTIAARPQGAGTNRLRSLIAFSLTSLPANATVVTATLKLADHVTDELVARIAAIHKITAAWTDGQVTWNNRATATPWTLAGGDFNAAKATVTLPSPSTGATFSWDIEALITWGTDTVARFIVKYDDETFATTAQEQFDAMSFANVQKPQLVIEYLLANESEYDVEVDWNNDGDFEDTYDDITTDVLTRGGSKMVWTRGIESELERIATGVLEIQVKNADGKYSPENTASVLYPNVLPGRSIRVRANKEGTIYNLFKGKIESIIPHPELDDQSCYILATDGMDQLNRVEITSPSGGPRASVLIGATPGPLDDILDDANWPAADRTIDAGVDMLDQWWAHKEKALVAIQKLMETEKSLAYVDERGYFVYEDRHHRLKGAHLTSQATFSDTMERLDYEFSTRTVRNRARVTGIKRVAPGSDAYIWGTQDRPKVPPGGAAAQIDVWAILENPVSQITGPITTTDWRANTASDATGTYATADVTVTATLFGAKAVRLRIVNNGTQPLYIVPGTTGSPDTLRFQGREYDEDDLLAVYNDATSLTAYGDRSIEVNTLYKGTWNDLNAYAQWIVSRYKDPQPDMERMQLANASTALMTQILTRKISDRITVTNTKLGISAKDYYINKMRHEVGDGGKHHQVTWWLERVDEAKYWLLGTTGYGELGTNTRLGF